MTGKAPARPPGSFWPLLEMAVAFALARLVVKAGALFLGGAPVRLGGWAVLWVLVVAFFVPGFLLAEIAAARWSRRVWPYATVVLVGSVAVALAGIALCDALGVGERFWLPPGSTLPRWFTPFLDVVMRVGVAAAVYASHRQALEAAGVLHQSEARQAEIMRSLAESRLEVARTQVRPEAFIDELRALRRDYLETPAVAEAGLERLIGRLRAASRRLAP